MPNGIYFTSGDVMTRMMNLFGMGKEEGETVARGPGYSIGREAMGRFSKTPIEFTGEKEVAPGEVGRFDPNTNKIRAATEGRSLRQISRTAGHEDIHGLLEKIVKSLPAKEGAELNEKITHGLIGRGDTEEAKKLLESLGGSAEVERALQAFEASERLAR